METYMQWTPEHTARLEEYLAGVEHIPSGMGTEEAACSVAAIRLAWDGVLSDQPPPCMSPTIAQWIIVVQDQMPETIRNSAEWRSLLPLAAGTERMKESKRLSIIMDWVFSTVLPYIQPLADERGFGKEWREMCAIRTEETARAARNAAYNTAWTADAADAALLALLAIGPTSATYAANAATNTAMAVYAARAATKASPFTANAATVKAVEAVEARGITHVAAWEASDAAWRAFNPVATLRKLIEA